MEFETTSFHGIRSEHIARDTYDSDESNKRVIEDMACELRQIGLDASAIKRLLHHSGKHVDYWNKCFIEKGE